MGPPGECYKVGRFTSAFPRREDATKGGSARSVPRGPSPPAPLPQAGEGCGIGGSLFEEDAKREEQVTCTPLPLAGEGPGVRAPTSPSPAAAPSRSTPAPRAADR